MRARHRGVGVASVWRCASCGGGGGGSGGRVLRSWAISLSPAMYLFIVLFVWGAVAAVVVAVVAVAAAATAAASRFE